jgi:hypothetical protein
MAKEKSSDAQQQDVSPADAPTKKELDAFYRYQYLDGEEKVFKTKEDLDSGFRKSYLRSRELERERKKLQEQEVDYNKRLQEMQKEREHERSIASQYLEWDRTLQGNPQIYQQVKSVLDGASMHSTQTSSSSNDEVSALREELKQLKEEFGLSQANSRVESAWGSLGKKYQDMDREAMEELLSRVESGDEEQLLDVLYHASRGYSSNGASGAALAQTDQQRSMADLSPSGESVSTSGPATYKSPQEAAEAAYRELLGQEG